MPAFASMTTVVNQRFPRSSVSSVSSVLKLFFVSSVFKLFDLSAP